MSERYVFSEEEGFFVDMDVTAEDDPDLGEELLIQDVLLLLNGIDKLKAVANVMTSDDAVFAASVLTTATNEHGLNQTHASDPYYLTKLLKELSQALDDFEDLTTPTK